MSIKNTLKSANNIRLGGELRLDKLYLRGGYGYYGKAFKPGDINENQDYSSISFGWPDSVSRTSLLISVLPT